MQLGEIGRYTVKRCGQEDPSEVQRKNGQSVNKGVCMCVLACVFVRASVLSANTDQNRRGKWNYELSNKTFGFIHRHVGVQRLQESLTNKAKLHIAYLVDVLPL